MLRARYAFLVAGTLISPQGMPAFADSVCGPGLELATNAWACVPSRSRAIARSNTGAQIGAAAGLLGIVGALASQLTATDNAGRAETDTQGAGNASRMLNRSGFTNMQNGNFKRAATAFKLAAQNARKAQNWKEAEQNDKNWAIAVAHGHLQTAVRAETKGNVREASRAYHSAMVAAESIGDQSLTQRLRTHHDDLVKSARKRGKAGDAIPTDSQCRTINGVLRCQ